MVILGIDPGTGRTGWGVIHNPAHEQIEYVGHGCIITLQDFQMQERLLLLHKELTKLVDTFKPTCMVVEQIFFGLNSKTAISVSQARGVVMLVAAQKKVPFFEYTSISVKHYLAGNGRTEKKDMQIVVRKLLSKNKRTLPFSSKDKAFDDSADALAIAIHHTWKSLGVERIFPKAEKKVKKKTPRKAKRT